MWPRTSHTSFPFKRAWTLPSRPAGPMYCRSGVRAKGTVNGVNVAPPGQLVTVKLDQVALMRPPEVLYAVQALRRPGNT